MLVERELSGREEEVKGVEDARGGVERGEERASRRE